MKTCASDGVPLALHARCWACESLAGPNHAAGVLVAGLCQECRSELAEADGSRPWPSPIARRPRDAKADRLITLREGGQIVGVDERTIRRWISAGHLDARELPRRGSDDRRGRRIRISEAQLRALVAERTLSNSG